jgi:hypothetical protein|tara:strand:+ start:1003 stop:1332 length:330 start_codon:yes stop_codon:yes gene_type:complete
VLEDHSVYNLYLARDVMGWVGYSFEYKLSGHVYIFKGRTIEDLFDSVISAAKNPDWDFSHEDSNVAAENISLYVGSGDFILGMFSSDSLESDLGEDFGSDSEDDGRGAD